MNNKLFIRELVSAKRPEQPFLPNSRQHNVILTILPSTLEHHRVFVHVKKANLQDFAGCKYVLIFQDDPECTNLMMKILLKKGLCFQADLSVEYAKTEKVTVCPLTMEQLLQIRSDKNSMWNENLRLSLKTESQTEAWEFLENYFSNVFQHNPVRSITSADSISSKNGFRFPLAVEVVYRLFERSLTNSYKIGQEYPDEPMSEDELLIPDRQVIGNAVIRYLLDLADDALNNGTVVGVNQHGQPLYDPSRCFSGAYLTQ